MTLTVVHAVGLKYPFSNGVQAAAWGLAVAQADMGAEVIVLSTANTTGQLASLRWPSSLEVFHEPARPWGLRPSVLSRIGLIGRVDLVHFHSVFIPTYAWIAAELRAVGTPYLVSPHGNLLPAELRRKWLRKQVYWHAVEKPFLTGASAIHVLNVFEEEAVHALGFKRTIQFPNVVDSTPDLLPVSVSSSATRISPQHKPLGVFLGKADVYHKGLDTLFRLAPALNADLHLYMIPYTAKRNREFDELRTRYPAKNVEVRPPVWGIEKTQALAAADFYLHLARWEVFGMSIVEAMLSGLPPVVTPSCALASWIRDEHLGLVVDTSRSDAVELINAFIADPSTLKATGVRASEAARIEFSSGELASKSLEAYRHIC